MTRPESVGRDQETEVLERYERRLGMYALFEEVMRHVDQGKCTFEEAVANYKHDLIHDTDLQPSHP